MKEWQKQILKMTEGDPIPEIFKPKKNAMNKNNKKQVVIRSLEVLICSLSLSIVLICLYNV